MDNLNLTDIKVIWDQMDEQSWLDLRSILENEKHKPEGINHELADKLIDKSYNLEATSFPAAVEDLYILLKNN